MLPAVVSAHVTYLAAAGTDLNSADVTVPNAPRVKAKNIAYGVALLVVPTVLAVMLLVAGLVSTSLALVWASIAASVIAVPAFVVGVIVLIRSSR